MREIRFHGRGGQGVIKSAQVIVQSIIETGSYAHFIPSFGVERKGSPVYGFLRMDDRDIRLKSQIYEPETIVIYDESLMELPATLAGLRSGGTVIINTGKRAEELELPREAGAVYTLNATGIALERIHLEIPNTVMLGAFAKVIGGVDWETIKKNIKNTFGEANVAAAQAGYDCVKQIKE